MKSFLIFNYSTLNLFLIVQIGSFKFFSFYNQVHSFNFPPFTNEKYNVAQTKTHDI